MKRATDNAIDVKFLLSFRFNFVIVKGSLIALFVIRSVP